MNVLSDVGRVLILMSAIGIPDAFSATVPYRLTGTITVNDVDILNISDYGQNLAILNNCFGCNNDTIDVVDLAGNPITSYSTPSEYNTALAYNGNAIIFSNKPSILADYQLREINPSAGTYTAPLITLASVPFGLGFDGTNVLVSGWASSSPDQPGVLTIPLTLVDGGSYNLLGATSVTVDTGTNITGTPTYGVAWHDGSLFVSLQAINRVYQFDSSLNFVQEIPLITDSPRGIAFIGNDLFVADRLLSEIYRYSPVPIPATIWLFSFGLLGLIGISKHKKVT